MINKNFWEGKKVLITGHTGFKGSWLGIWLTYMNAEVYGIALPPDNSNSLFDLVNLEKYLSSNKYIDICKFDELKKEVNKINPDVVFHLAAQPLVRESYYKPLETWSTNVNGSLNLLESLKLCKADCAVIMVTTDKVYENKNWDYGYRENDKLGGHDPYSASKAAAEIAIASWRSSFCGFSTHQTKYLNIATTRAGNVIGGGDWAEGRLIPDAIRSLLKGEAIEIRSPLSTRPWQHVIEPLSGYILLAEKLSEKFFSSEHYSNCYENPFASAYNFGPNLESNKTVMELINEVLKHWPGTYKINQSSDNLHEAEKLQLQIDKAKIKLNWRPKWGFEDAIRETISWYKKVSEDPNLALDLCIKNINEYEKLGLKKTYN